MIWNNSNYLMHYGMPRRSGRYKWGSGKDPYHHGADRVNKSVQKAERAMTKGKEYKAAKNINRALGEQRVLSAKQALKEPSKYQSHEYSTGHEYDKEYARQTKKLEQFHKKYDDDTVSKLVNMATRTGNIPKKLERYMDEYTDIQTKQTDALLKASLKDIGYKDIEAGARILYKYANNDAYLNNTARKYNVKAAKIRRKIPKR